MINKKIAVLFTVLFLFPALSYAGAKNFVSLLNGMSKTSSQGQGNDNINISKSFVGQSVVFKEVMNKDLIANSGFASAISRVQNQNISFEMITDLTEAFKTQVVPLQMKVVTTSGNIEKIKYQILVDSGTDKWEEHPIEEFNKASTVVFTENISFSTTTNYIKFYAINDTPGESGSFSPVYTVRLSTDVVTGEVKLVSPDPLVRLSSLDPQIQTTTFDNRHSSVTITLNDSDSGAEIYKVYAVNTEDPYKIYNSTTSRIDFLNSSIKGKKLVNNRKYTLTVELLNTDTGEQVEVLNSPLTFTALDGGVTNILTYPSPFNPNKGEKIKIRYTLAKKSKVTIRLYDKAGKVVCKLLDSVNKSAGTNEDEWDGRNYAGDTLATGAYICEIIAKASDGEHRRYTALAIVGK